VNTAAVGAHWAGREAQHRRCRRSLGWERSATTMPGRASTSIGWSTPRPAALNAWCWPVMATLSTPPQSGPTLLPRCFLRASPSNRAPCSP